jgi:hypothetical protein
MYSPGSQDLSAALKLRIAHPPAGAVIVQNHSSNDARIWDIGNTWGDDALSFEIMAAGQSAIVKRNLQRYTRNVPSLVIIALGSYHEIPFDLGDGTWALDIAQKLLVHAGSQMRAIYASGDSPEVQALGVWRGQLRTSFIPLF